MNHSTRLCSVMTGDVFLVNGEAHAVMMIGFERFEFLREEDAVILCGKQFIPPIPLSDNPVGASRKSNSKKKEKM